jgi:hypothetical protein
MPPPTASQKPAKLNGNGAKAEAKPAAEEEHSGKPDQNKYNAEQDALNKEIAALKTKQVSRVRGEGGGWWRGDGGAGLLERGGAAGFGLRPRDRQVLAPMRCGGARHTGSLECTRCRPCFCELLQALHLHASTPLARCGS